MSRAILLFAMCAFAVAASAQPLQVVSPDGNVTVGFELKDAPPQGALFYSVAYKGKPVILPSRLGLNLQDAPLLASNFAVESVQRDERDGQWSPPYGERKTIPEKYREMTVALRETAAQGRHMQLVLRAYNEGAALRYVLPAQEALKNFTIAAEATEFQFPAGSFGWEEHGTEGEYARVPVEVIKPNCECPLTVQVSGGTFASIVEAHVENYSRMLLSPAPGKAGALVSAIRGPVAAAAPFATPWRAIVLGERPGDLLERNSLVLNLNPPCAIADTSWIKPSKVIRETTLSTAGGKACVDFAVARKLSYVEYDAGWYGHEYDDNADARAVNVDPKRNPRNDLNLPEVIEYARQRGVGILLYVNRRALERQLDELLPLYQKWGVKGLKFGFVNVGPQQWTNWLSDAVRKAAEHQLVLDIHDGYRPTGLSRTYPNLLTQEGVRGNEHMPTARHNVTLPFTRAVAGAFDYTICYYNERIQTTRAHQLAQAAAFYSPLQFLYWYDRPANYQGEPEIAFFDAVPTVWDETKVLQGEIGEYASIARRSGDQWFVGNLTNEQPRELKIPLDFLKPGAKYVAHIYGDGDLTGQAPTKVSLSRQTVDSTTVLTVAMAPSGGQAIHIVPATADER